MVSDDQHAIDETIRILTKIREIDDTRKTLLVELEHHSSAIARLMGVNRVQPKKKETRGRKPRGAISELQRVINAVNSIVSPVNVSTLEDYFDVNHPVIPKKNIGSYLGKASRDGTIEALGNGLYQKVIEEEHHAQEEKASSKEDEEAQGG